MLSERERRSLCRLLGGRSLLLSTMFGDSQGMGDTLLAALNWRSHRCLPGGGGGASSRPPKDVQYHCMAPRLRVSRLVED